ncbi:MAG: RHS repeat domain-containing protein [Gemmataceae bacterium]
MVRKQRRFTSIFTKKQRRSALAVEQLEPRVLMTSNLALFTMRDFLASALERTFRASSASSPLTAPSSLALASSQTTSPSSFTSISGPIKPATSPNTSSPNGPFLVDHDPFPAIVPTVFSSTSDDPAGEIVQASAGSQGGNPMSAGFSSAGVRFADGVLQLNMSDITSSGFGTPWGQTTNWTNGPGYATGSLLGNGVIASQMPTLHQTTTSIALLSSGSNARFFDFSGGAYTERFFLKDKLIPNTTSHDFSLTDSTGKVLKLYDFSTNNPTLQQGTLESSTDQYGNVTSVTSHAADGKITEVQSANTVGSTTITDSYLYSYFSSGANQNYLQNVTLRRKVNAGAWSTIRQTDYAYYDGVQAYGNLHDLQTAKVKDAAGNILDTKYFRYYLLGDANGYQSGLKYEFNPQSYARLAAAYANPLTATDAQVSPYADLSFQYDSSKRVSQEIVQGDGSSLAGSNVGLGTYSYSYTGGPGGGTTDYNAWATKTVETLPDGNQNSVYCNPFGEVMLKNYHDAVSGNNWRTYYQYDTAGRVIEIAAPSAVTGYNDVQANLAVTFNSASGLVTKTDYYTTTTAGETTAGGVAGFEQDKKIQQGSAGTPITLDATQYFQHTAAGNSVDPVANHTVYRNTNTTGGETTSYSYTWFTGTTLMQSEQVTKPVISSTQNGPGTADVETTFFDSLGRPIWTKDADGFINYFAYDQGTSALVKSITDVDTTRTGDFTGLPTGWTTPSGGGLHLITQLAVDGLGRPTQLTDPLGNITYTVYNDSNYEKLVYPGWNSTTNTPTGPTQVVREDRPGSYMESLTMSATPHLTGGVPDGTEAISGLQTLARAYTNAAGQVVRNDAYFNLTGVTYSTAANIGTKNTNYYESLTDYDNRGWQTRTQSPTGTITRTVHDGLGRTVSTWVGTNDTPASGQWSPTNNTSPSNMIKTADYVYDNNTLGGSTQVGDSNVTQIIAHPGGTAADRVTEQYYDWRDRLVASKDGVQATEDTTTHRPITYRTYDNLDEVTEVQQYDGDTVSITSTGGVPNAPSASLLRAQTITSYDDQGRVYKTQEYSVDPSTGTVSTNALTTQRWYDHRGDVIKSSNPGGEVNKSQFDGAGRATISYVSDGGGDAAWADASNVTGDNVLSQIESTYDKDGNVILVTDCERNHDETTTGALGNPTTAPKARVSYTASYYDLANRLTGSVDVGTNGGTAWTRPSSVPTASDTVLVTLTGYNAAGWVNSITDPRGIVEQKSYDNLGELTQTIEAYTNGTPTTTTNKTTNYTYDGDGHQLTLQAVETGGASETTKWIYGVTTTGGSDVNSNSILATVQYPDPSTGAPSSTYQESYAVNALGQNKTYTDKAGNVHTYTLDVLGRVTSDAITTLATGFDGAVRRIDTAYDTQGNPYLVTSYDAATAGNIVNQVQRAYNGLGQMTQEWQAHSGAVITGTTPSVQYAYSLMSGGANHSRLTSITYPNGKVLTYNYSTGLNDSISRLSSLSDTSGTLESYDYLGLDTVVKRAHSQPGVDLTYIKQGAEGNGDAGDQYTGLDRFGRVVDQRWIKTNTGTATDRFKYGYDRDSNALYRDNLVNSAFGQLYHVNGASNGYDNLNQLSGFLRGVLSDTNSDGIPDTVASASHSQTFTPDAMGNFSSVTTDGTAINRTHNQQNEVTGVGANTLVFDKNGNMTTDEQGRTLVFDAWNRLVAVKSGSSTLAGYKFDAIGRRIVETAGTDTRDLYFGGWNVLEERLNGASTVDMQYVWNLLETNSQVLRDRSTAHNGTLDERLWVQQNANGDVTALLNTSGSALERYDYDSFGKVSFLTASWTTLSGSAYALVYLYQDDRSDPATGLLHANERDYSPTLQRWVSADPSKYKGGDNDLYRFVGDNPVTRTDPTGLKMVVDGFAWTGKEWVPFVPPLVPVDSPALSSNDERFRAACKINGVPDKVTDILITTANNVDLPMLPALIPGNEHKYCNDWVTRFRTQLIERLTAAGYKSGLMAASKEGITGLDLTYFFCPGGTLGSDENHTAWLLTFKDATKWWIDCSTLSAGDVTNLRGGASHFTQLSQTPSGFRVLNQEKIRP